MSPPRMPKWRRAEIDLLLLSARVPLTPGTREQIRGIVPEIRDWEYVVQAADLHGVLFLLYHALHISCQGLVPRNILNRLRESFRANAVRNLSMTAALFKVLSRLEDQHISAVPFKGPVLGESLYGDLCLRPFVDIDILVHEHDALDAFNLLLGMGYTPEVRLDAAQFSAYVRTEYSMALFGADGTEVIELHWDMAGRYLGRPFRLDLLSGRLESLSIMGKRVRQLRPEERLVYLCVHGSKDGWRSLESITSIRALLCSRKWLDWDRVFFVARKMRCRRMLLLGLLLARQLLDADVPGDVLGEIDADGRIGGVAEKICDGLFPERYGEDMGKGASDFSSYHLRVRDGRAEILSFLMRLVFRPSREDWRRFAPQAGMLWLLYLLRPLRLINEMTKN